MRKLFLWVGLFSLVASGANAASYVRTDGTVVDPILTTGGAVHSYSGANLQPSADLNHADLTNANLVYSVMMDATMTDANLANANLYVANLSDANLRSANLTGANLYDEDLTNATFSFGTILFDEQTVAQHGFDAAGLRAKLEGDWGANNANNLTIIPEPTTLLLALLALVAAPLRVRCG